MANIGQYNRLLLLLKHSLIIKTQGNRTTNKKYLCDSNYEMHLYYHINWFFASMKDVF